MSGSEMSGFISAMLAAGLMAAVPLVLAALGEAVSERSGLLNLGIEGMMLAGAFFGFFAAYQTGSVVAGIIAGIAAGLLLGLVFGFLTITLQVDQVLVGLAITIFSGGLTAFLYRDIFGRQNPSANVTPLTIALPGLRDLPIVGPALFDRQLLFYIAYLLVPVFALLLARTRFGLNVRAVGESPFAADAAGVSVARTRYLAIAIGGSMAGFAGAFLAVADLKIFQVGMTVGMGFIALAITMVGGWNPWRILITAVLFGMLRSLGNGLQIIGVDVRTEFITMLPYVGIMVAMVLLAGRTALPSALGVPYARGRR
ncbi:MAG: ABC transporter permease [Thermomicrobiales bacterium]|nr:ABC transporter permease [Thermomicrobiales bacterium]